METFRSANDLAVLAESVTVVHWSFCHWTKSASALCSISMSNLSTSADIMDVCAVECVRNMPEKRAWDPRETEELIAIFKQCSWLWDPESHHYRDKIKTIETYDNIAKNFNTTPQEVHKKLLNLRKHFNNEWRRCRSRKCHKPGFEDIPGSSWQHFHSLLFLKTVQKNRELVTKEEASCNQSGHFWREQFKFWLFTQSSFLHFF